MENPWIAEQRAVFAAEVAAHKTEIAAMLLSEGDALQTCESLLNRVMLMRANGHPSYTIMQMLKSGFYGPINHEGLPRLVYVVNHSGELAKMFTAIDQAMAGSDTITGFTDQGLRTDPNGWRTPRLDMGGNVYNDWDGGGVGHVKAEVWREWFETSALQAALKALLDPQLVGGLDVSGKYDDATKAVVELFQQQNNLEIDGIAGPKTWAAINGKLSK